MAEQIGELKRGTHVVVATPGRLIDVLTMQSGKVLSLRRVTFIVLDEADRMYDMGFAPQISAITSAIRPDRQTVLFSATFPKAVETLARKSLQYPVEVMVGGRSVASDNVTQYAELVEDDEKFLRLLQLLGEHVEGTKKVIVFVDTQVRADALFEQLLRNGYPALSLHGGMEQEDRDSTISDFKRKDGPNVLAATGVAGRGLDVPLCSCVINFSAPNHLEAYVHQVGRTGTFGGLLRMRSPAPVSLLRREYICLTVNWIDFFFCRSRRQHGSRVHVCQFHRRGEVRPPRGSCVE